MKLWAIALNTFREGIRARVLYALVFFSIMMMVFSYFLGQLSIGENLKVMKDLGLSAISLFGILIAIFVGIGLIYKELERRTIYTIVSKPIRRSEFIIGKYLGLSMILWVQLLAMSVVLLTMLRFFSNAWHWPLLTAIFLIYLELLVITAVAIFFSSFSSPFLSALFTLSLFIIGHSTTELAQVAKKSANPLWIGSTELLRTLVNFDYFNISSEVVHGIPMSPGLIANTVIYGFCLVVVLLTVSVSIFQRRDFK